MKEMRLSHPFTTGSSVHSLFCPYCNSATGCWFSIFSSSCILSSFNLHSAIFSRPLATIHQSCFT